MRILAWLFRAAVFFALFAFALNNNDPARVKWFFGYEWSAPMIFIVLAAFVGLREGELLELRRSDIDGITGRMSVTRKVDKEAERSIRGACAECGRPISSPKTRSGVRTVHVPSSPSREPTADVGHLGGLRPTPGRRRRGRR